MSNNSNKSRAQFPEIRDYLLEKLGWADEAQRVGFNRLPTRVVGTVGGLTTKMMVELAEREATQGNLDASYQRLQQ